MRENINSKLKKLSNLVRRYIAIGTDEGHPCDEQPRVQTTKLILQKGLLELQIFHFLIRTLIDV